MTEHLIGLGHTRIAFVKGHDKHGASHLRAEGYRNAMEAAGLLLDTAFDVQGDFSFASGVSCGENLLALTPRPTAVFCANDQMALGVMSVAHRQGLRVPHDLSIAGFDDAPSASMVWPPLTTIRQPIFEMAEAAANMLIEQKSPAPEGGALSVSLEFALIQRESTAPPA